MKLSRPRAPDARAAAALRKILDFDLSSLSDRQLRDLLKRLERREPHTSSDDLTPEVFAVVNEAISRRLGAWSLFAPDSERQPSSPYRDYANRILTSSPYRDRMAFYTDPDYLESEAFDQCIEPLIERMELDCDERTVVKTIVYVAEKSKLEHASSILLPAEFYRAIAARDDEGTTTFRATREQLLAGLLLHRGHIVEMNAGEGKTIAAAFPAVLHALSGDSVHVITSNDYLAARDADWLAPVYESLGLTVGAVLGYMADEERTHVYRQQIVYGTLRELGFDYLRDNLKLPPDATVQGTLDFVIVDEADHALIDQARTPLTISGDPSGSRKAFALARRAIEDMVFLQRQTIGSVESQIRSSTPGSRGLDRLFAHLLLADPNSDLLRQRLAEDPNAYNRALAIVDDDAIQDDAEALARDLHYAVDPRLDSVTLTDLGQAFVEGRLGAIFDTVELERQLSRLEGDSDLSLSELATAQDRLRRRIFRQNNRMNQVYQMLRAFVLLERDVDYVVTDGAIVLVEESTGRTLPDNRYQQGLHVALEAKEGVALHPESETLAQISVQGYIKQYSTVAGMSGTALGARDEFEREYGLTVVPVPPTQTPVRVDLGARLYVTRRQRHDAVLEEIEACRRVGRPVLVGTLTIEESEEISRSLNERGIMHRLLNAVNSSDEAQVIKSAGAYGAVTIATNMAGRGTDIVLEPGIDSRITQGYLALTHQLLRDGAARVELGCATAEESRLLQKALAGHQALEVTEARRGNLAFHTVLRVVEREEAIDARPRRGPLSSATAASALADASQPAPGRFRRGRLGQEKLTEPSASSPTAGFAPRGAMVKLEFGLGLLVIGTGMNQSSRIDRQLRGRSGRQGAFGASRFYLSLEDPFLALRSDNASHLSDDPPADPSLRTYFEGFRLERHLRRAQARTEREDVVERQLTYDYTRVIETQTLAYYRERREVIETDTVYAARAEFASQWATRLVDRHFPGFRFGSYVHQFERMAEELWTECEIDCYALEGASLDGLAERIAGLMIARLERAGARLGNGELRKLENLVFLRSSDELWKDHLADLHELMLCTPLGLHGHDGAVAEFAIRSFAAYARFKERVVDVFLPRLLTFPTEEAIGAQVPEFDLIEDVSRILV